MPTVISSTAVMKNEKISAKNKRLEADEWNVKSSCQNVIYKIGCLRYAVFGCFVELLHLL